jgi:alpha-L-fucosidase
MRNSLFIAICILMAIMLTILVVFSMRHLFKTKQVSGPDKYLRKIFVLCSVLLAVVLTVTIGYGIRHLLKKRFVVPSDPLVASKLNKWQDQRFGLLMHWGAYTEWEEVESWSICPEEWIVRKGPFAADFNEYTKAYEQLPTQFNPVDFNPEKWAKAAKDAGMGYVVFTTKHHDGFCMFDTKQTDYKITNPAYPYATNPRANITKEVFNAFRKDSFMIGAYFSKPDFHHPDFWWRYYPIFDRNVNYDISKHPEKWKSFEDFTYRQVQELMTDYGKIDILWLDGSWVRYKDGRQRIDMSRLVKMSRQQQPGLIVVNRDVPEEFEDYATPEQKIPENPLDYAWESCISMGDSWTYTHTDQMKPSRKLITMMIQIVSKGGNFLLNIGPSAKGDWTPDAYKRLADIGAWMKINGEGIHKSQPVAPYTEKNICYTQAKDATATYAFLLSESDTVTLPETVTLKIKAFSSIKRVTLLGTNADLKWSKVFGLLTVKIPGELRRHNGLKYAAVFKIER